MLIFFIPEAIPVVKSVKTRAAYRSYSFLQGPLPSHHGGRMAIAGDCPGAAGASHPKALYKHPPLLLSQPWLAAWQRVRHQPQKPPARASGLG